MDIKKINLGIITREYKEYSFANYAYHKLSDGLFSNSILRDYRKRPITSDYEIEFRKSIDSLLDYYSILEIGIIANYFPNPLPTNIRDEIQIILDQLPLKKYYEEYYPLFLPQLLLKQTLLNRRIKTNYIADKRDKQSSTALFDRFLMLNQVIKNDSDIEQFLWFLDDGWTDGYSISDFWEVLASKKRIEYKLGSTNIHPLNAALWGYIKYLQYLSDFACLLRDSENIPLLQSAFWHFQSYWLDHMKDRIGNIMNIGIENIRFSLTPKNLEEIIKSEDTLINSEAEAVALINNPSVMYNTEIDIQYLLNPELGVPIKSYLDNM